MGGYEVGVGQSDDEDDDRDPNAAPTETRQPPATLEPTDTSAKGSQPQKLSASDEDEEGEFGTGVAIDGDTILVGAPDSENEDAPAYEFVRSGSSRRERARVTPSQDDER